MSWSLSPGKSPYLLLLTVAVLHFFKYVLVIRMCVCVPKVTSAGSVKLTVV